MEKETKKCSVCGESVLPTDKFCKNCGRPLQQNNENKEENVSPNKKVLLTFEALDQSVKGILGDNGKDAYGINSNFTYSIEVDGDFIGKINPNKKIETFVTIGKHKIKLNRNKSFLPNEEEILVNDNKTILLYSLWSFFPSLIINPSDLDKEEIWEKDNKIAKTGSIVWWIFFAVMAIAFILLFLVD